MFKMTSGFVYENTVIAGNERSVEREVNDAAMTTSQQCYCAFSDML
jgi:hypothetical protein